MYSLDAFLCLTLRINLHQVVIMITSDTWLSLSCCSQADSDGSLHKLDYARDLRLGLGLWPVNSVGAARVLEREGGGA